MDNIFDPKAGAGGHHDTGGEDILVTRGHNCKTGADVLVNW